MPDYDDCVIYEIKCKDPEVIGTYIGHTTEFEKRKGQHKCTVKTAGDKKSRYIRDNGGWENWKMKIIEEYPCKNKKQAEERERYWIYMSRESINSTLPSGGVNGEVKLTKHKYHIKKIKEREEQENLEIKAREELIELMKSFTKFIIAQNKSIGQSDAAQKESMSSN